MTYSFCLQKHGLVCAKCCDNRHTLVKRELDELKAKVRVIAKALVEQMGPEVLGIPEKRV